MVDWGDGRYEDTARALAPVSTQVVDVLDPLPGARVLDVGCGTGNGALEAARRGAQALGVDASPRLVKVARRRAGGEGLRVDDLRFAEGDATALPVEDASFDAAISVFGVIFAPPLPAAAELRRAVVPGGRVIVTAWLADSAIHSVGLAMGAATGMGEPPAAGPRWTEPDSLEGALGEITCSVHALTFRATSPDAWLDAQWADHPLFRHVRRVLEPSRLAALDAEALAVLRDANEDPSAFAVTSRYLLLDATT